MARQSAGFETSPLTMRRAAPGGLDVGDRLLGLVLRAAIRQHEIHPFGRQLLCHDAPDPLAPGDDGDLSAQIHGVLSFAAFDDGRALEVSEDVRGLKPRLSFDIQAPMMMTDPARGRHHRLLDSHSG